MFSKTTKKTTKKSKLQPQSNNLVYTFLHMLNTVKLYHWKTISYSTHKATDQLYADLNLKIDEFVEILLGKPSNINSHKRNALLNVRLIKLNHYNNNEEFKRQIEQYKIFLMNLSTKLSTNGNSDLMNKKDELLALFNQFLYLLTLKA
jgi:hypothetical protein